MFVEWQWWPHGAAFQHRYIQKNSWGKPLDQKRNIHATKNVAPASMWAKDVWKGSKTGGKSTERYPQAEEFARPPSWNISQPVDARLLVQPFSLKNGQLPPASKMTLALAHKSLRYLPSRQ